MYRFIKHIIVFVLVATVFSVQAQTDTLSEPELGKLEKIYLKEKHLTESPYEVSFKKELPYYGTAISAIATGLIIRDHKKKPAFTELELSQLNPSEVNSFDREVTKFHSKKAAKTSDIVQYTSLILPILFTTEHATRKDIVPLLVISSEVYMIVGGIVLSTKHQFRRTRPLVYNDHFSFEERTSSSSRLSFISGHTAFTSAFTFHVAKVVHDYHPGLRNFYKVGLWSGAVAIPLFTGYLRIRAGKHFYTDVAAGFAVGSTVGWLVTHLHKKKKKDNKLSLAPFSYDGASGFTLTLKLD